jgi:Tol biopolymer transport system component
VDADGRVALLVLDADGEARLAIGRTTGSQPLEPLTSDEGLADRAPAFGPDGTVVLFGRVRGDGLTSAGIWSIPARGEEPPVRLTTDGAYPRWLP